MEPQCAVFQDPDSQRQTAWGSLPTTSMLITSGTEGALFKFGSKTPNLSLGPTA